MFQTLTPLYVPVVLEKKQSNTSLFSVTNFQTKDNKSNSLYKISHLSYSPPSYFLNSNQDYSKKQFQEVFQKEWEARWQANRQKCSPVWELFCRLPQRKNLKVFKDLRKAEASLYLQILSARIGLASFLFRANVPDFQSPLCSCGFGEETAQHITFSCNKFLTQRQQATFLSYNFSTLLQKPKVLKEFLLWFMSLKRLDQFNLAHQLLPENLSSL